MGKEPLDKNEAIITSEGHLDFIAFNLPLLKLLVGHYQQLRCPQVAKILLFTMNLSNTILGLVALVPILALSLPFSLDSYLHSLNLSASSLNIPRTLSQSCSVSNIPVPLGDQTTLSISDDEVSSMITAGRGIQNYTCISGAYVSTGALAK